MSRDTLHAFVHGSDLEDVAASLAARFTEFVGNRRWIAGHASIVNHRYGNETPAVFEDLPRWDLGLNFELPDPGAEPPGWFADVDAIAQFLGTLHDDCGRDFVLSMRNAETGGTVHLFDVSTGSPDLAMLRGIIGVIDS